MQDPWRNWFRVREVGPEIWRISDGPFVAFHLVRGAQVACFIDSGWGAVDITKRFAHLIDGREVMVANTHVHPDHSNGNAYVSRTGMSRVEWETHGSLWRERRSLIRDGQWKPSESLLACSGEKRLPRCFDPDAYNRFCAEGLPIPTELWEPDHEIDLGHRVLRVIPTPGHTQGHLAFLEPDSNDFFGGDMAVKSQIWLHLRCRAAPRLAMGSLAMMEAYEDIVERLHTPHGPTTLPGAFLGELATKAQGWLDGHTGLRHRLSTHAGEGLYFAWGHGWGPVLSPDDAADSAS